MRKGLLVQIAHRGTRKLLNTQISAFNKAFNVSTRFCIKDRNPEFVLPLCVGTGFGNTFWKRSWKTEVIGLLTSSARGTFLDVGANVGQTLLDVCVTNPSARYLGFEPNISNVFYLREMIRANSLSSFLVIPAGLADENRCLPFYRGKGNTEDLGATIRPDLRPDRENELDFIPCFRFDDIRCSLGVKEISLIKIDVEGAELEALMGMSQSLRECRPVVLCEVLFADTKANLAQHEERNNRLIRHLRDLDYRVFQLIKSPNQETVIDARCVEKFISAHWTAGHEEQCDYVFVPAEKDTRTLKAILSAN